MNILVTGGAGYIGSVAVDALLRGGHEVVVLDDLSTGHRQALPAEAGLVQGDIADREVVGDALTHHGIEAVMHFAAYSLVGESMEQPERYFRNNCAKTLELLATMLERGVKRFVLSSTAALFGIPDEVPIAEEAPVRPSSVYGETKQMIERMLHWFRETRGLGFVTLRYFNAAGAVGPYGEDHHPETHLIPLLLQVALGKRERIDIFGDDYATADGTCIRDYIHVADLATAHLLALEALRPGERRAYNLGNGQGYSVLEVLRTCREVTGHAIPTRVVERRAGDPAVLVADSSRIREELDWHPRYPGLRDIVASAWNWHREHPEGYRC